MSGKLNKQHKQKHEKSTFQKVQIKVNIGGNIIWSTVYTDVNAGISTVINF